MVAKITKHLCYDCLKAVEGTCSAYEGMTEIIEENFEIKKILFQVPECDDFIPEEPSDDETEDL